MKEVDPLARIIDLLREHVSIMTGPLHGGVRMAFDSLVAATAYDWSPNVLRQPPPGSRVNMRPAAKRRLAARNGWAFRISLRGSLSFDVLFGLELLTAERTEDDSLVEPSSAFGCVH